MASQASARRGFQFSLPWREVPSEGDPAKRRSRKSSSKLCRHSYPDEEGVHSEIRLSRAPSKRRGAVSAVCSICFVEDGSIRIKVEDGRSVTEVQSPELRDSAAGCGETEEGGGRRSETGHHSSTDI